MLVSECDKFAVQLSASVKAWTSGQSAWMCVWGQLDADAESTGAQTLLGFFKSCYMHANNTHTHTHTHTVWVHFLQSTTTTEHF